MRIYIRPEFRKISLRSLRGTFQASAPPPITSPPNTNNAPLNPIDCLGATECVQGGNTLQGGTYCDDANGSLSIRYYAPGSTFDNLIICSVTINNQPASVFCDSSGTANSPCGNGNVVSLFQCFNFDYTCAGNEDVVVSCPGFDPTPCEAMGVQ